MLFRSLVLSFSYWKTFLALRRHRHRIEDTLYSRSSGTFSMKRYKNSFYTMLYVVGLALFCYLPYICLALPVVFTGRSEAERAAWTIVDTLLFLNSLLNPILCCWRMRDIRRAVIASLRNYFPLCEVSAAWVCLGGHVREMDTRYTKQESALRTEPNKLEPKIGRASCRERV